MLVSVETAWLFTRGRQTVRIVRAAGSAGAMHLLVQGPDGASDAREFSDVLACVNYQADLERRLVSDGFTLERFTGDSRAQGRGRRPARRHGRRRALKSK